MFEILIFLLPSFACCLLLTGILGYLGIHVLHREIIFIDIALAQVASVGYAVGYLVLPHASHEEGGISVALFAVTATFIASAFFACIGKRIHQISQETVIGVTYAITAALTLFLLALHAGGDVHLEEMLTGSIIWIQWPDLIASAAIFGGIGIFQYLFRRRFLGLSKNYHAAPEELGMNKLAWDFLFYASMGIVITHSVKVAGVLMTFSLLIIPTTFAALFARRLGIRLAIGWFMAAVSSAGGLYVAYQFDFSTGPSIVAVMTCILVIGACAAKMVNPAKRGLT